MLNLQYEDSVPNQFLEIMPCRLAILYNIYRYKISALEIEFPADMTWFKANVNGTGFYRVNYPRENWDALIQKLIEDHNTFSALDRAQLISDAFALTR